MSVLESAAAWQPVTPAASRRLSRLHVLAGVLLGLPVSYPDVPYYWAAFAVMLIALFTTPFGRLNRSPGLVLCVLALCGVATLSNLLSPYAYVREPARFLTSSVFYLFFLAGLLAWDRARELMAGLAAAILLQALAVLAMSVVGFRWSAGVLNWTVPELRLWGSPWFPDWPNFYAILLSTGFLLFLLHYRRWLPASVCMAAGILTTSRSVYLALAIGLAWLALSGRGRSGVLRAVGVAALTVLVATGLVRVLAGSSGLDEFVLRMGLLSDRQEIWASSLALFTHNPWLGVGGVMLDESVGHAGYASFHNSFAEVLVRHGVIGFGLYLALLFIHAARVRPGHAGCAILLFYLLTALFQNTLRHPHFFMMFSFFAIAAIPKGRE
ncbi:MAG: O-antigen ligase family protein [Pseudomonadota bacterium]